MKRFSRALEISSLALATVAAYWPALRGGFVWDDHLLQENPALQSLSGLRQIWLEPSANKNELHYWPVVYTGFWIERALFGPNPLGYHLVNVVVHVANVLLFRRLLDRIGARGAFLSALLFAIHPVHVESVAWVIELKDVLSGMFYFLALLSFISFARKEKWRSFAVCAVFFLCALLSKSAVVTLPAALYLWLWWERSAKRTNSAEGAASSSQSEWIALVSLTILAGLVTIADLAFFRRRTLSEPLDFSLSVPERALVAGRAAWFYFLKLLWPANLMAVYPRWKISPDSFLPYAFPLAAIGGLALLFLMREKIGRAPLVSVLFFGATHAPTLGFVVFEFFAYSFVADRFQYLACAGLIALFGAGASTIARRLVPLRSSLFKPAVALALIPLGLATARQTAIYKDMETHSLDNLRHNPGAWVAHNNLGYAYSRRGEIEKAIEHYSKAVELNPTQAVILNNLGALYARHGDLAKAVECFNRALTIKPDLQPARENLENAQIELEGEKITK